MLAYTAYLGGQLVYDSGVGVEPAHGVYRPDAPTLQTKQMGDFIGAAVSDLAHGVQHMAQELRQGHVVPALTARPAKSLVGSGQTHAAAPL